MADLRCAWPICAAPVERTGKGAWWSSEVGGGDHCDDGRRWAAADAVAGMGGGWESEEEMRGKKRAGHGSGGRAHAGEGMRGELGLIGERSSILASLFDPAEEAFLHEVGSAGVTRADLPNNKTWENDV
jgi:hypothetical protein